MAGQAGDSGAGGALAAGEGESDSHPWPSAAAGYFALAVIIFGTFLNFFDAAAFALLIEHIRAEFHLSNTDIGLLQGPVNIAFYVIVMLPLSRLADVYPRKYVLAVGALLIALLNASGGLTSTFLMLAATRMLVGAGGGAHAPGSYSMLSDFFRPEKRRWPFALLQLGFIGGSTLGLWIAGRLLALALTMPERHIAGITLHSWKYVLLMLAIPGIFAAVLFLMIQEPPRQGVIAAGKPLPFKVVFAEIWTRRAVYGPLFIALGLSTMHAMAVPAWTTPLFKQVYGWSELEIASRVPFVMLAGQIGGLVLGPVLLGWLAKRHRDVNVRGVTICFACAAPLAIIAPLMPNGWAALVCFALGAMFGLASATPQNLTIQEITPNQMRGQLTGLYLMMFTVVGSFGVLLAGVLTDLFGKDSDIWKAMVVMGALLFPAAAFVMSRAIGPYKSELARMDAQSAG